MFTFVVQICLFSSVRQDTLSPKFANISCKTEAACHPGGGGGGVGGGWGVVLGILAGSSRLCNTLESILSSPYLSDLESKIE